MNNYKNLNRIRKHLVKHNTLASYWLVLWKTTKPKAILLRLEEKPFTNSFGNLSNQSHLEYQKVYVLSILLLINSKIKNHLLNVWIKSIFNVRTNKLKTNFQKLLQAHTFNRLKPQINWLNAFVNYKTILKPSLSAKLQTTNYLDILMVIFPFAWKNTLIFKTYWKKISLRIKTDLTKILNPITKPRPKTQHSFKLYEDLTHQSFPSSTVGSLYSGTNMFLCDIEFHINIVNVGWAPLSEIRWFHDRVKAMSWRSY